MSVNRELFLLQGLHIFTKLSIISNMSLNYCHANILTRNNLPIFKILNTNLLHNYSAINCFDNISSFPSRCIYLDAIRHKPVGASVSIWVCMPIRLLCTIAWYSYVWNGHIMFIYIEHRNLETRKTLDNFFVQVRNFLLPFEFKGSST